MYTSATVSSAGSIVRNDKGLFWHHIKNIVEGSLMGRLGDRVPDVSGAHSVFVEFCEGSEDRSGCLPSQ